MPRAFLIRSQQAKQESNGNYDPPVTPGTTEAGVSAHDSFAAMRRKHPQFPHSAFSVIDQYPFINHPGAATSSSYVQPQTPYYSQMTDFLWPPVTSQAPSLAATPNLLHHQLHESVICYPVSRTFAYGTMSSKRRLNFSETHSELYPRREVTQPSIPLQNAMASQPSIPLQNTITNQPSLPLHNAMNSQPSILLQNAMTNQPSIPLQNTIPNQHVIELEAEVCVKQEADEEQFGFQSGAAEAYDSQSMRGFRPTQHLSYGRELDIKSRVSVISWSPNQAASKLPQASEDANESGRFKEECLAFDGCNKVSTLEGTSGENQFQEQQPEDLNIIKSSNYYEQDGIGSLQAAHFPDTVVTCDQSKMAHCHGERPKPKSKHMCDECGRTFTRSSTLTTHKRIHTGDKPYMCEQCGRAFRQLGNLSRHQLTHTTSKPYICQQCNKAFNRASNLHTHVRTHSDYKPFSCDFCGKRFHQKVDMKIHRYTHTGEKPHKCQKCGRGFKQLTHLTYHMRTHSDVRMYQCEFCGKGFNQKGNLKAHVYRHTGERPFKCDMCGKGFTLASTLNTHKRTHAPHKPFHCQFCEKAFYHKNALESHYIASHPFTGGVSLL